MDPTFALVNQYGIAAVIGYLLAKDLGGYLLGRFFPKPPPPAPLPGVAPGTPATPPNILLTAINDLLAKLGHPTVNSLSELHPAVQDAIKAGAAGLK